MNTQTIPVGLIFRQIAKEKRLSAEVIGKRLGMTRQNVNYLFNHKSQANILELEQWAEALETSRDTIEEKWHGKTTKDVEQNFPEDLSAKFERIFKEWKAETEFLRDQIKEKDQQIKVLLGKSKGTITRPLSNFPQPRHFFWGV